MRAVLGSRKTEAEMSFEAVSYCDLAQNLETVHFLFSKKDLDRPKVGYPIIHKERCNSFQTVFVSYPLFFSACINCLPFGTYHLVHAKNYICDL